MKTLFIEALRKLNLNKEKLAELESQLPRTIYIAYSIQYKNLAEQVRKEIKSKVLGFSQVLGCSDIKTSASAILLIGEARFHALNLALSSNKPVFIFDNHSISRITEREINEINKREKGKYLKFLASDNIGILVSSKPGQNNSNIALKLKKQLELKGKKAYLFTSDNISVSELENFPDIEIWINTACRGLSLDSNKIINYSRIKSKNI
ncbi:MAG: diphthamide synthesis protein [Nanoarchaeota archaeon]|nr:diphthamide synthesis protein [Nanoarchaeota archaeon]MBU4087028.1 diphthamide synthesis protein [Nanoarchaeota archaeon]